MKNNQMRKWLMTLAFICLFSSSKNIYSTAKEINIVETVEENDEIMNIITKYHLEEYRNLIEQNQNTFLKYYQAILLNPTYKEQDIEVSLKDFWIIQNYFTDIESLLKKVKERKINISSLSNEEKDYENISFYFTHDNKEVLYLKDGKPSSIEDYNETITSKGIKAAIASDLTCMNYSDTGFTTNYFELNQILQAFHEIYGRENVLKFCAEEDFLAKTYSYFQEKGIETEKITAFFHKTDRLKELLDIAKRRDLIESERKEKDELIVSICQSIIKIYEKETNKAWQENQPIQATVFSLIKQIDYSILSTSELRDLKEKPNFLKNCYIDLTNCSSCKVAIDSNNQNWSGEFCFPYQISESKEEELPDTFAYSFTDGKLMNAYSYNEKEQNRREEIQNYGIKNEAIIEICINSEIFNTYESLINASLILTTEEKKYFISHFEDFINLHPSYFKANASNEILQELLTKTFQSLTVKEDIYKILLEENIIYTMGGSDILEELKNYGITDFESQKYYIQNYIIFKGFLDGLNINNYLTTPKEEYIYSFPNFIENNPSLNTMKEQECYEYVKTLISNISEEGLKYLLKKKVYIVPKPINTRSKKIVWAYV